MGYRAVLATKTKNRGISYIKEYIIVLFFELKVSARYLTNTYINSSYLINVMSLRLFLFKAENESKPWQISLTSDARKIQLSAGAFAWL